MFLPRLEELADRIMERAGPGEMPQPIMCHQTWRLEFGSVTPMWKLSVAVHLTLLTSMLGVQRQETDPWSSLAASLVSWWAPGIVRDPVSKNKWRKTKEDSWYFDLRLPHAHVCAFSCICEYMNTHTQKGETETDRDKQRHRWTSL